jgi:hypothetical protein
LPATGPQGEAGYVAACRYVALMITGDVIAYIIGLGIERTAPAASLPAFLAMYFLFLWVAWIIAVRITQPRMQAR